MNYGKEKRGVVLLNFLINHYPTYLNRKIAFQMPDYIKTNYFEKFKWLLLSHPSEANNKINQSLKDIQKDILKRFDGLSVDAIAQTGDSQLILVNVWASIEEMVTPYYDIDDKVLSSFDNTSLCNKNEIKCINKLYEYTSSISQFYYLQKKHKEKIWLANIYFYNDYDNAINKDEFRGAVKLINNLIGLDNNYINDYFLYVFINTLEINKLVKQSILEQLDLLCDKINRNIFFNKDYVHDEWRGADVIISNRLTEEIENWLSAQPVFVYPLYYSGFISPKRRAVITKCYKELSWLFCQLRDIFKNYLDFQTKYNFYGQLAQAAQDYIQKVKEYDCNSLLNIVLNEAKRFVNNPNWIITIE